MEEEEEKVPAGTFPSFMSEGTLLARRGEHGKALACFSNALKLRPGDKHCLVARSKCYLRLGDTENALKDAEASLQSDKTFSKGLYQKAEALYTMGDFEFALVLYHRGRSLHPELQKLSLGIEKAQEAIVNCIGSPSSVKLQCTEELRFVSRQAESKKANQKPQIKLSKDQKWAKQEKPVRSPRAERQLLGELYADRTYLEELLRDKELMESSTRQGVKVAELVQGGISYLDARSEFWQQQKPLYARLRERRLRRQGRARRGRRRPAEFGRYLAKTMEDIDLLLAGGCPGEGCQQVECVLRAVQGCPEQELPNKAELLGSLHGRMGSAQLQMGQVEAALQSHRLALKCAEQNNLPEAVSRALDNIGRVYTRAGRFPEAIATWEKKIPMAKSSLEKAWLFHELGQCYLQLNRAEAARGYGEKSLKAAEQEGDVEWQLHATLLVAEAQVQLEDHWAAILAFERALEKAKLTGNKAAQKAITTALEEASKSFVELDEGGAETTIHWYTGYDSRRESRKHESSEKGRERGEREQRRLSWGDAKHREDSRSWTGKPGADRERRNKEPGEPVDAEQPQGRRGAPAGVVLRSVGKQEPFPAVPGQPLPRTCAGTAHPPALPLVPAPPALRG